MAHNTPPPLPLYSENTASVVEEAEVVVLPVPYEKTVTYGQGTAKGPDAILRASAEQETFDPERGVEIARTRIFTLPSIDRPSAPPEEMVKSVYQTLTPHVQKSRFTLTLGGEHTLTLGAVQAHLHSSPKLAIVQIDAHLDLRNRYLERSLSHATVMRRIFELPEKPLLIPVGTRSVSLQESEFIVDNQIAPFWSHQIDSRNDQWIDQVLESTGDRPIYLTLDIDGLDPSQAPGTGTPEPGGLDYPTLCSLLDRLGSSGRLRGMDLVEVAPIPGQQVTESLAARLISRVLAARLPANSDWISRLQSCSDGR
ncbi:MAG: agmatinase [Planctomycetota bacterium]|nr:agmatinase [Planctomycetota bacterium]